MRRLPTIAILVPALAAAIVVAPVVAAPAVAAEPVTPTVQHLTIGGVDAATLASMPELEHDEEEAEEPGMDPVVAAAAGAPQPTPEPVVVTEQISATEFSAVGVSWAADEAVDNVAVHVRTRTGNSWSEWVEAEVQTNATADEGTVEAQNIRRHGSDLLYVGPSTGVQVRVDAGGVKPSDVRLSLVDPGQSPADATAAATAAATVGTAGAFAARRPAIVSRAEWGADESLRGCVPSSASALTGGILHNTATSNSYTASESAAIMRSMYAYHTRSLGWCDLGYNFVVDKYGTVFQGRYGALDQAIVGAHTGGFNSGTVGVSIIGNYDLARPTAESLASVQAVFAWKFAPAGIDPTGSVHYTSAGGSSTKWAKGTIVRMPAISGHRDYSTKSCPGNYAYPLLPTIRTATAARIFPVAEPGTPARAHRVSGVRAGRTPEIPAG